MTEPTRESIAIRADLLFNIAGLRAGLVGTCSSSELAVRLRRFTDTLAAWGRLPDEARAIYAQPVLDGLFELVAELEDSEELPEVDRLTVELSLWQAIVEMRLADLDVKRNEYILRRQSRLEQTLESSAAAGAERILYAWSGLLRSRTERVRQLPGPFRDDIAAVVYELAEAGLPRRAMALANKFRLQLDPLVKWAIDHRPEHEEAGRTRQFIDRVEVVRKRAPYRVLVNGRSLGQVLSAPVGAMPLAVGASGTISIGGVAYGAGR